MELTKPVIFIIGAGAAGFSAALTLAERGYKVELLEKNTLGSGATGRNPGRMGHGFHYTDIETACAYLRASIRVQRLYPDYLVGKDLPADDPIRHGRYFVVNTSNEPATKIMASYRALRKEYARLVAEDPTNEVFGPPKNFFRVLKKDEFEEHVNPEHVQIAIETNEHLFNWKAFANYMKKIIEGHPNINLREHCNVEKIQHSETLNAPRFTIDTVNSEGFHETFQGDFIVNSTWENIQQLNDQLGLRMKPDSRTNRLKALLTVTLPSSLQKTNSMFFCMGQHSMVSNLGNGRAMLTYAKVTNLETSTSLTLSDKAQRFLRGEATTDEKNAIASEMLQGICHYVPEMKHAIVDDVQFGIVQTLGKLTLAELKDINNSFNKRADHGIKTEAIGVISNPCMKLFYFADNGEMVADLVAKHVEAKLQITNTMILVADSLRQRGKRLNPTITRALRDHMHTLPLDYLLKTPIQQQARAILLRVNNQQSLNSFFKQPETQANSEPLANQNITPRARL